MRTRVFVVAAAAVVFVAGVAAVESWRSSTAKLSYADLKADPAFALRMPGADELGEVGGPARTGIDGSTPTFAGHIFGTLATRAEVYAYYERELARLAWRPQTPPFAMSSAEIENREYCKPKESFRLAIKDKDRAFQPAFYRGHDYVTVFDATLIADDPQSPCPLPPLSPPPTPPQ